MDLNRVERRHWERKRAELLIKEIKKKTTYILCIHVLKWRFFVDKIRLRGNGAFLRRWKSAEKHHFKFTYITFSPDRYYSERRVSSNVYFMRMNGMYWIRLSTERNLFSLSFFFYFLIQAVSKIAVYLLKWDALRKKYASTKWILIFFDTWMRYMKRTW